jgi:hypothetical protein
MAEPVIRQILEKAEHCPTDSHLLRENKHEQWYPYDLRRTKVLYWVYPSSEVLGKILGVYRETINKYLSGTRFIPKRFSHLQMQRLF